MTSLEQAANEYLAQIEAGGLNPATVRNVTYTLQQLCEAAGPIRARDLGHHDIDRWRAGYAWAPSTYNRKLSDVRQFVTWLQKRRYLDPSKEILFGYRTMKNPKRDRLRIPRSEWDRLLDSANHPVERVLVACGLYTMARPSEIVSLRVGDWDRDNYTLSLYRHKQSKPDLMPVCLELHAELTRWMEWYEAHAIIDARSFLIPSRTQHNQDPATGQWRYTSDGRVNPTRPQHRPSRAVQRVLAAAGYSTRREGGHTLRRSAARAYYDHLVDTGHDGALRQVQTILDHSSSVVTEGYLGTTRDKVERDRHLKGRSMFGRVDGQGDDGV